MRIAYVSLHWPRTRNSGVGKKIQAQMGSWTAIGHEVRLFMHTSNHEPISDLVEADYFFYATAGKIKAEISRINATSKMITAIRDFHPDLIYLRYGIYVYPIHRLADIAPVVEEMTTNDLSQHEGLGSIYSLYNRLTRGIILSRASGLVCLSNELAKSSFNTTFQKPTKVVGDGIEMKKLQPLPAPNNLQPQLVFIGSPGSIWQGVDKLPFLARAFPDMGIHIIGYDHIDGVNSLPNNIKLYGYLKTEEYRKILAGMDCAIGSLGLHRINLNESSPLKTRECLALGLPMILPYKDTDLDDLNCDFLLKIPNREDNIQTHTQAIYDFACQVRGRRVDRKLIQNLDQTSKEVIRTAFFQELLSE
jgi:hypothetical protein